MNAKKYFLKTLDTTKIKNKPRNNPIQEPYMIIIDDECDDLPQSIQSTNSPMKQYIPMQELSRSDHNKNTHSLKYSN